MKRARLRWSRPGIPVNVPLFLVGLALILGPTVGIELGGVKVPVLGSWWIRGLLVAVGVVIMALSFFATEPPPAPPGDRARPLPPLPTPVPGTSFIGYVPDLPSRFVARAGVFDTVRNDVVSHGTVAWPAWAAPARRSWQPRWHATRPCRPPFPTGSPGSMPASRPHRHSYRSDSPPGSPARRSRSRPPRWAVTASPSCSPAGRSCWSSTTSGMLRPSAPSTWSARRGGRCCSPPATAASPAPSARLSEKWTS